MLFAVSGLQSGRIEFEGRLVIDDLFQGDDFALLVAGLAGQEGEVVAVDAGLDGGLRVIPLGDVPVKCVPVGGDPDVVDATDLLLREGVELLCVRVADLEQSVLDAEDVVEVPLKPRRAQTFPP